MIDETPENIARNDHSLGGKITEAEETAHDPKIDKSKEADQTAAHRPPVHREHGHRGETEVGRPITVGETMERDTVETQTSGGRGVHHKGQHLPGHLGHLEEGDGNEVAMTLRAREQRHVHPGPLLASNDALAAANTAISKRIARASSRRRKHHREKTQKAEQHPKRGSRARRRTVHAARHATSSWTKMPRTSRRGQRSPTLPTSREAGDPSGTQTTKWEGTATPWSQDLPSGFPRRLFGTSTSTESSIRGWRNVAGSIFG